MTLESFNFVMRQFTPHNFRRTARSNTKRLKVDFETAEAMMNLLKSGMERIYDSYELEDEKAAWFLKWEQEIADIATRIGVADALGGRPKQSDHGCALSFGPRWENRAIGFGRVTVAHVQAASG